MSCHRCGEAVNGDHWFCSGCRADIDRERVWADAGLNPDGDTPFDSDFAERAAKSDSEAAK